jgi:hypothetical protein
LNIPVWRNSIGLYSFRQEICVFKRLAAVALAASLGAFAQTNMRPAQASDKEKIADALMDQCTSGA